MEPDRKNPQDEFDKKPAWKHPYFAYLAITVVLFGFLVLMARMAIENDWIPNRGITQPR